MKKLVILFLTLTVMLSSCFKATDKVNNKINVVCTAFPQYDFLREIAKDNINLHMLLPPGAEPHSYEPSPQDIILLNNADIFVMTGGESEHWALHLLEGQEDNNTVILNLSEKVTKFTEENTEGMESESHAHSHETNHLHDDEINYDEHIWTSPDNAKKMCDAITETLCAIDKDKASLYNENLKKYDEKLTALGNKMTEVSLSSKRNVLVFGDRFPLRYLTEFMSLDYYAAFPGCSSKTEPSAKTVAFLSDKVNAERIPVVLYMDYSDGRIAKTIAKESSAKARRLYSCHNLSREDFRNGESYISLMEKNLAVLKEALN